jgi:hypothetical protein
MIIALCRLRLILFHIVANINVEIDNLGCIETNATF